MAIRKDSTRRWRWLLRCTTDQRGLVTIELMVIIGISFLLLVLVTNLIAVQFGLGILRAAADEGARAGSRVSVDAVGSCNTKQQEVLNGIGKFAQNITHECVIENDRMIARVSGSFSIWLPGVDDITQSASASSRKEEAPLQLDANQPQPAGQNQPNPPNQQNQQNPLQNNANNPNTADSDTLMRITLPAGSSIATPEQFADAIDMQDGGGTDVVLERQGDASSAPTQNTATNTSATSNTSPVTTQQTPTDATNGGAR